MEFINTNTTNIPENLKDNNVCVSHPEHIDDSINVDKSWYDTFENIGYYINNYNHDNITIYSDGSFTYNIGGDTMNECSVYRIFNAKPEEIGHLYVDFMINTQNIISEEYSFIGAIGEVRNKLDVPFSEYSVVFYIIDSFIGTHPNSTFVAQEELKIGVYKVDGAEYTVYKFHYGSDIAEEIGYVQRDTYYSIRSESRDHDTIDISAHIKNWNALNLETALILNVGYGVIMGFGKCTLDVPLSKIYVDNED